MQQQDLEKLLDKYKQGTCTPEERAFVESWYLSYQDNPVNPLTEPERMKDLDDVWNGLRLLSGKKRYALWPRIAAAAILIISLSAGLFFYAHQKNKTEALTQNVIRPGGNKAILTLANGQKINLTEASNGQIARQAGATITKTENGQLVYQIVADANSAVEYNTIEAPAGGQWQVVLPDRSKVWLNALSSITYPTRFAGQERRVKISGEAYFEIAHNKAMPFRVESAGQTVEVLGTHFDIMAYRDEKTVKTTLLEGAVKVTRNNATEYLKPGDQAQSGNAAIRVTHNADLEEAVAWKNGYFIFNDEDLESVMRKVSRWYDVEVIYKDEALKTEGFGGRTPRYSSVTEVLETLEGLKLARFKVEGRRIMVSRY